MRLKYQPIKLISVALMFGGPIIVASIYFYNSDNLLLNVFVGLLALIFGSVPCHTLVGNDCYIDWSGVILLAIYWPLIAIFNLNSPATVLVLSSLILGVVLTNQILDQPECTMISPPPPPYNNYPTYNYPIYEPPNRRDLIRRFFEEGGEDVE